MVHFYTAPLLAHRERRKTVVPAFIAFVFTGIQVVTAKTHTSALIPTDVIVIFAPDYLVVVEGKFIVVQNPCTPEEFFVLIVQENESSPFL